MFYLVACDQSNETRRMIKIDRSKPTELIITEDPRPYTPTECLEILQKIRQDNKETGGLELVTYCYGIIGFVKFHGPYYMLLITKRRMIGTILTHDVYSVEKSEIIPIPAELPQVDNPQDEERRLDCFCSMDLSNGFFFSYSYNLAQTLQQNMAKEDELESVINTTFIWNHSLTKSVRKQFRNPIWTVSLIHGFFKQIKVSGAVKNFRLTIIARRSRHFAGPRFFKRGINEEGKAANDVEIEQIVFEETEYGIPAEVTSVVQRRGSIPLRWSQEMLKCPISSKPDESYNATWLHFENLKKTYGDPIIVLNLIKRFEKKPCESPLGFEFEQAIQHINTERLSTNNRILFVHMDVKNCSRRYQALPLLHSIGSEAFNQTRILHCQITPVSDSKDNARTTKMVPVSVQKGVLRTNCLDCLDRTNIAQFAYGLVCLRHQLHALIGESVNAIIDDLSDILMDLYEHMGDALSMQYAGSPAVSKMIWKERGQCRFVSEVQGCFRSTQRLFNNKVTDRGKQNAYDMFLGLDSANICRNKQTLDKEKCERSLSKSCCGIPWKTAKYYAADTKLYPVMIELEEAMHQSLTMKQVHPVLQYDERFTSGNSSRKQGTLVAEVHNHSSRPGSEELFCSNFLVLDEGSNADKFLEESVSEG